MQGVARTLGRKRKVPLLVGCGQGGEQMGPRVVWEELGSHFIDGETGAQRKEELRLEAGAWGLGPEYVRVCGGPSVVSVCGLERVHLGS